jgi:predicted AlkP superfamily phosphohydrolase/phosphomutase
MRQRVLVIGLDGATFKLISPWVAEGRLPTFAKLMQEGCFGDLLSTPNMVSPAAWTSLATGENPGKHGIYDFMDLVPGTLKLRYLNSSHRESEPVWSLLNKAGKKVGVLNVPMTYPADQVNGFMISGWNAPSIKSKGFTWPANLIDELLDKFGDYPMFPTVKKHVVEGNLREAVECLHRCLDLKIATARYLMQNREWDFLIAVLIETDQVQHYFWHLMDQGHPEYDAEAAGKYGDAIFNIYQKCDKALADFMEYIDDDTTLFVMSDHGSGMNHGGVQYLPLWLKQMGLTKDQEASSSNPIKIPGLWLKHQFKVLLKEVYNLMNKRLSIKQKGYLNVIFPNLRDKVEAAWRFSACDWSKTRVYFHYEPRINLKGREPFGIVSPGAEYEALRDYLIEKLYECKDVKTGQRVVEKVYKREEAFHGPQEDNAPDLIIQWKEDVVISGLKCKGEDGKEVVVTDKFVDDPRTGNHTARGIFLAFGKNIKKGIEIDEANIIDIAPTILYLMGASVPKVMDGSVLKTIFTEDQLEHNPITYTDNQNDKGSRGDGYSDADIDKVRENLNALGYLN